MATERQQLMSLYREVEGHLKRGALPEVDVLLQEYQAKVRETSTLLLVGALRSTFCARDKLPTWRGLYEAVWAELDRRGQIPDLLLMGLDRQEPN